MVESPLDKLGLELCDTDTGTEWMVERVIEFAPWKYHFSSQLACYTFIRPQIIKKKVCLVSNFI